MDLNVIQSCYKAVAFKVNHKNDKSNNMDKRGEKEIERIFRLLEYTFENFLFMHILLSGTVNLAEISKFLTTQEFQSKFK